MFRLIRTVQLREISDNCRYSLIERPCLNITLIHKRLFCVAWDLTRVNRIEVVVGLVLNFLSLKMIVLCWRCVFDWSKIVQFFGGAIVNFQVSLRDYGS